MLLPMRSTAFAAGKPRDSDPFDDASSDLFPLPAPLPETLFVPASARADG
jgi:hypothetical protein